MEKEEKQRLKNEVYQLLSKNHNISRQEITDKVNIVIDNWIVDLENKDSHLLPQDVAVNISSIIKGKK